MVTAQGISQKWVNQLPAEVFACLVPGELRIILHPGAGMANGGVPLDVPMGLIPPELWVPNTLLWVQLDDSFKLVRVWKREASEAS
ncbi:MAG: hypothetical protein U0796_10445 [Gemmatales bacterium]